MQVAVPNKLVPPSLGQEALHPPFAHLGDDLRVASAVKGMPRQGQYSRVADTAAPARRRLLQWLRSATAEGVPSLR